MSNESDRKLGACPFCEQGQLTLVACAVCHATVALCDECELIWSDPHQVRRDPQSPSASSYPHCPHCQTSRARWYRLTPRQLEGEGW